jgi:hypothetical protein
MTASSSDAYFSLGVQQVWLVNWPNAVVDVSRSPGSFRRVRDTLRWRTPVGIAPRIGLAEVFAGT